MPPPFKQITRDEFALLVEKFSFTRRINAVHMHHTWRPNRSQYDPNDGHRAILAMYLFHTQTNGWQDIAQHITIAPDGSIWLGRNWNLPPASAAGNNGNSTAGPFMFETLGDFDTGHDVLDGEQRKTVIEVIARVQKRWDLPPESLRFHNMMSSKSCPGTGIDYPQILSEVRNVALPAPGQPGAARSAKPAPFPADATSLYQVVEDSIRALERDVPRGADPADAEPTYEDASRAVVPEPLAPATARGAELTPEDLSRLRPHLVNLTQGRFSNDGEWKTDAGDVDAIFEQHLAQALLEAQAQGKPLRILFYAHGGLVKESAGLAIALKHLDFWLKNGIYPINFVWETGLFETIGALLRRSQEGARGFISDQITDPLIEATIRALQGPTVWGGMKRSAELSVAPADGASLPGGARYVAEKLKAFCAANAAANIELHAVGHSAGSIFHAHFLSSARQIGVPSFRSAHFLAPAARVDLFTKLLAPLTGVGKGLDRLTLFTMSKDYERDDECARIYRKSLLYLIYYALEPEREASILGLEQSLRADPALVRLFGLNSTQVGDAEVVFSVSPMTTGRSATRSTSHGGFDDDAPTLESVARRVLGKQDADSIFEYVPSARARALDEWADQVDWPERLRIAASPPTPFLPAAVYSPGIASTAPSRAPSRALRMTGGAAGRRRALCIGINAYATAPLYGCVADAESWAETFGHLGFETALLRDAQATRAEILRAWQDLITGSGPGDVIALQYSGHGTQLDDLNGDESDGQDEALCPFDFATGAFLIDDDIRELFETIPDGVNLTCFFDCCHSGSTTRFAAAVAPRGRGARNERRRFIPATPEMKEAHRRFRAGIAAPRALPPEDTSLMRNVSFAACKDDQVAWESEGHGDFTVRATRVLSPGLAGLSNEQFQQRVIAEFGAGARQSPWLECAPLARTRDLLQPFVGAAAVAPLRAQSISTDSARTSEAIQFLQQAIDTLQGP